MALQGTIDAFPLVDVVQLLGASRKTGRLTLESEAGTGRLWVDDGHLVAAEHAGTPAEDAASALVDLLRPEHGSFTFDPGEGPDGPGLEPVPLLEALEAAGALLEEWRTLTLVVPSPRHRPVLEATPAENPVMLDARAWSVVVAVADGPTVEGLAAALGLGELAATRALADLVSRGLVRLEDPVEEPPEAPVAVPSDDLAEDLAGDLADEGRLGEPVGGPPRSPVDGPDLELAEARGDAALPPHFPIDDLVGEGGGDADPWGALEADDDDRFAAAQPFADHDAPVVLPPVEGAGWDVAGAGAAEGAAFTAPAFDASGAEVPGFDGSGFDQPAFTEPAFGDAAFSGEGFADEAFSASPFLPAGEGAGDDGSDLWDPVPAGFDGEDATGAAPATDDVDGTDEILRQMSRLSPKAAEAIAAALGTGAEAGEDGDGGFLQDR